MSCEVIDFRTRAVKKKYQDVRDPVSYVCSEIRMFSLKDQMQIYNSLQEHLGVLPQEAPKLAVNDVPKAIDPVLPPIPHKDYIDIEELILGRKAGPNEHIIVIDLDGKRKEPKRYFNFRIEREKLYAVVAWTIMIIGFGVLCAWLPSQAECTADPNRKGCPVDDGMWMG